MSLRDELVSIARAETRTTYAGLTRRGTRWQHQARTLGVALDCIGLIGAAGVRMGLPSAHAWFADDAFRRYSREPDPEQLLAGCRRLLLPVPVGRVLDGDVYVLAQREAPGYPRHFALAATRSGRRTMIHCESASRRTVEQSVGGPAWIVRYAFRFPELAA